MKRMLALMLLVASFSVQAEVQVSTQGLTDAEKAVLIQQIEQIKVNRKSATSAEKVGEWVDIGTKVGLGLAGAAKELGVQANQFATTPVGKMTMGLIVYKVAGSDLLKVLGAFTVLIAGWVLGRGLSWAGRRERIEYNTTTKNIFGNHPIKSKDAGEISGERMVGVYTMYAVGLVGCFLTLINI